MKTAAKCIPGCCRMENGLAGRAAWLESASRYFCVETIDKFEVIDLLLLFRAKACLLPQAAQRSNLAAAPVLLLYASLMGTRTANCGNGVGVNKKSESFSGNMGQAQLQYHRDELQPQGRLPKPMSYSQPTNDAQPEQPASCRQLPQSSRVSAVSHRRLKFQLLMQCFSGSKKHESKHGTDLPITSRSDLAATLP